MILSRLVAGAALGIALLFSRAAAQAQTRPVHFTIRIENISTTNEFTATNGTKWTWDLSPGVWVVSHQDGPLFVPGKKDRGQGLKSVAEEGATGTLAANLGRAYGTALSGTFSTPVHASKPGGIRPGQAFEFTVTAKPGQKLFLAAMFGQSNDWFYAPGPDGIALFNRSGNPLAGNVTARITLWDAGTEADEEPGIGSNQGPREKRTNSGPHEWVDPTVHAVTSSAPYARVAGVMHIVITPH